MRSATEFVRARVCGTLTVCSPLHVGTGDHAALKDRAEGKSAEEGKYAAVCLDHQGCPYLPASGLRGFLRRRVPTEAMQRRLFGFVERGGTDGEAGRVRLGDARLVTPTSPDAGWPDWDAGRRTAVRRGIGKDPRLGTNAQHLLFAHEYVPPGAVFRVAVEADRLSEAEFELLQELMGAWDGGPSSGIGAGRSKLKGQLRWKPESAQVLTSDRVAAWLAAGKAAALEAYFAPIKPVRAVSRAGRSHTLRIHARSPLLVNQPALVEDNQGSPKLQFDRLPDGRAIVPAESIAGAVRGRARRILVTLLTDSGHADAEAKAEDMLGPLFGRSGWQSPIWFGDAVSTDTAQVHRQTFNAIDRFHGGVARSKSAADASHGGGVGGKLYSVAAAAGTAGQTLTLDLPIVIHEERAPEGEWWKGLLLLVLRDALEEEIAVGWGRARGYGCVAVELPSTLGGATSWTQLLQWLQSGGILEQASQWIALLHESTAEEGDAHA